MTHVEFLFHNNLVIGYNVKGHAQYNVKGPDILCSSISTASQMTLNGIIDWIGLELEEVLKGYDEVVGLLSMEVPKPFYENATVQQLFKSFMLFMEQLEIQYSEYVKIERRQKE